MKLRVRRSLRATALLGLLASCGSPDAATRKVNGISGTANVDSMGMRPTNVQSIATDEPKDLVESSSVVMSFAQPGIVFTINDSGNEPVLFALDTSGATRGRWTLGGARNRDWEAMSRGPCTGSAAVTTNAPEASCLFIGDVGDNGARRTALTLYQVSEPSVAIGNAEGTLSASVLNFRYSDGAHDVESIYVGPDATVYLITKRELRDDRGNRRPALVFSIPAAAWASPDTTVATLLDSLPIVPGSADKRQITDASLSHDARYLAVRTYGQIFTFATDTTTGRVLNSVAPSVCNILKTERKSGEGVTWFTESRELLLSNEGRNAPLHRITCPLPSR